MKEEGHMEGTCLSKEELSRYAQQISDTGISFAEKYLEEQDPLREYIVAYYSDLERLESELQNVLGKLEPEQIEGYVGGIEQRFSDKTRFIELFERIQEKNNVFARQKERLDKNPIASEEEYDAGVYREGIEQQVVEAVFSLRSKGYDTFQSGFTEGNPRNQFIDFYNKNISVPDALITQLANAGFKMVVLKLDDRTTVELQPIKEEAVRLSEWKNVWNMFASGMSVAENEDLSGVRIYANKKKFQETQDRLKAGV